MILVNHKNFIVELRKKPKGERFKILPKAECNLFNFHRHKIVYKENPEEIESKSYYLPLEIKFIFLFWLFVINIKPEELSGPLTYVRRLKSEINS